MIIQPSRSRSKRLKGVWHKSNIYYAQKNPRNEYVEIKSNIIIIIIIIIYINTI